jgi:predicted ribosome quality control (RQC) complex YloA/Tae2 family protein
MALDGITIAALTNELNSTLVSGRIVKIAQPENDELLLTIKIFNKQIRLSISSDASLPLMYLTEDNKPSPLTAPGFCMVLRKHLNNAKILNIFQPSLERIVNIELEHYNEMGDLCKKYLIIELMGKHSNIIFTDDNYKIIDSIKRIPASISSVREVLPGRDYFIPDTLHKHNPTECSYDMFKNLLTNSDARNTSSALLATFTGISPIIAEEISHRANIDSALPISTLDNHSFDSLYKSFSEIMSLIKDASYNPVIYYRHNKPIEFNSFPLVIYSNDHDISNYSNISSVICDFYKEKNQYTRIKQKSVDLRRIVTSTLEKDYKKYELQLKQLKDTEKRDKFKVYGELITTYGYQLSEGEASLTCTNYYTDEEITIPLDRTISPMDNAKKYFDKYNKLKRTANALGDIIKETEDEIAHLESISNAMDIATTEDDLKEIKEEMILAGYIKRKGKDKKDKYISKPLHFISSDGFHMYVGKNNIQNEELTFKVANGGDLWFHSKSFPGSHVIVKTDGKDIPDNTYEEAAKLAAFYSKGKNQDKVEIDYIERKHVKKVAGSKPGFVIYHTHYSMAIEPDITGIQEII